MAKYDQETIVAPGHVVWGAIEDSEGESEEEETPRARQDTAVSMAPETRPTKGFADLPCKVILSAHAPAFVMPISPPGLSAQPVTPPVTPPGKAKASRHQSRTPSPEPRMPSSVPLGRKVGYNSANMVQPCKVNASSQAAQRPAFVPKFAQSIEDLFAKHRIGKHSDGKGDGKGKAKALRHQSRTPSPEPRMPSSVPIGRKFDNIATSKKAAPFKGAAATVSSDDEDVSTPRVRTCVATQKADAEANFQDELDASLHEGADEEANLTGAEEEVEEVVAGDAQTKNKKKKKASRPFKATRIRYRKFMVDQCSAIANDPFNFNLAAVEIPPCLVKETNTEAKVLLKLHLRAEQAKQATLQAAR